ncbi:PPE family protein [Mycobacterium xenopi RIVM700367]|uniref:PPE family protein n=1 Tax=Mycobacterium xenopi TaxID=1789 RepID=UPI00025AD382|nr:PPE family protein [Mycobacterium xenopi]EID16737.1 PPE family protein [Mycobacterium xenopi RIVM700367]
MDFGALPPEINSGRMYTGPGSGPMLAAAAAWDALAANLHSAAAAHGAVVAGLTGGPWLGPASASMAAAAAPYAAWLTATATQAEQVAAQAKAAVVAYEAAFAMTVPPPVIEANRSLLMSLIATNFLGQNTPAIAATEAQYLQMWAQDAAAMYGYAATSAHAATLTPFAPPPITTNPAGLGAQAAAVGHTVGTSSAAHASSIMSAVPGALQSLAAPAPADPPAAPSPLSLLSLLSIPSATASTTSTAASSTSAPASFLSAAVASRNIALQEQRERSEAAEGIIRGGVPGAPFLPPPPFPEGPAGAGFKTTPPVSASIGQASSLGALSVPRGWATAAPAIRAAALAVPFTSTAAAPAAMPGNPGSLVSGMALAGMAGSAIGNTVSPARQQRTPTMAPTTRVEPQPPGNPAPAISAELRELALAVLRESGDLTDEEFTEKQRLSGVRTPRRPL